ncbi:hypothetical protein TWF281_003837 [Arthrobotrys megalospora]
MEKKHNGDSESETEFEIEIEIEYTDEGAGEDFGVVHEEGDIEHDPGAESDTEPAGLAEEKAGPRRSKRLKGYLEWKPHYTKSRRKVYKLENVQQKDNTKHPLFHHDLAPIGTPDAWYIQMSYKQLSDMLQFQGLPTYTYDRPRERRAVDPNSAVFVSLRYVRFAAQGMILDTTNVFTGPFEMPGRKRVSRHYEVKKSRKLTEESNENGGGLVTEDKIPTDFLQSKGGGDAPNHPQILGFHANHIGRLRGVPFRTGDGALYWGALTAGLRQQKYHRDVWYRYFLLDQKHKMGGEAKGWRVRYDDRDLEFPLVVEMLPSLKNRFSGTRYNSGEQLIGNLVNAINLMYTQSMKKGRKIQLEMYDKEVHFDDDYHLLSKNPFGMFQTYIRKTDVHKYMKELESDLKNIGTDTTPIRRLPAKDKFEDYIEDYLAEIDGGNAADKDEDEDEDTKTGAETEEMYAATSEKDAKTAKTNWEEEGENEINDENSMQGLIQLQAPAPQAEKKLTEEEISKEYKSKISVHYKKDAKPEEWRGLSEKYNYNRLVLSSKKISDAKGTRKGQKSQKDVMGFSASQWLHLCAYSWGGLLDDEQINYNSQEGLRSSQAPENLILGTSEANSCMTRYESSWQSLFSDEAHLAETRKGGGIVNIRGFLNVQRNPQGIQISKDDHAPGKTLEYLWQFADLFPDEDDLARRYAAQTKLLAYTVLYEPSMTAPPGSSYSSLILQRPSPTASDPAVFYPFSRRFFHRAEYLLDAALYQAMYILAANETLAEEVAINTIKQRFPFTNEYIKKVLKPGDFIPEDYRDVRMKKQMEAHQATASAAAQQTLDMAISGTNNHGSDIFGGLGSGNFNVTPPQGSGLDTESSQRMSQGDDDMRGGDQSRSNQEDQSMRSSDRTVEYTMTEDGELVPENINPPNQVYQGDEPQLDNNNMGVYNMLNKPPRNDMLNQNPTGYLDKVDESMDMRKWNKITGTQYPSMAGANPDDYDDSPGEMGQTDGADTQITGGRRVGRGRRGRRGARGYNGGDRRNDIIPENVDNTSKNRRDPLDDLEELDPEKRANIETKGQNQQQGGQGGWEGQNFGGFQ